MYKVLVTGATGGLGRNVIETLHSLNFKVTATGRNVKIGREIEEEGVQFRSCDLTNAAEVRNLFKEQDYIIHTAAMSSPWGGYHSFYSNNVIATQNVVDACRENNIKRLVHISTPSLYFDYSDKLNITEHSKLPKNFVNNYALTKFKAEQIVDQAFLDGLETIILRPRAIFGKYDTVLMPRIIKVAKNGTFPIFNGGKNIVDITYVNNVVNAILLGIYAPKAAVGEKFNITNGEPMMFKELLDKIFKLLNMNVKFKELNLSMMFGIAKILEGVHSLPFIRTEPIITRYGLGVLAKSQTLNIEKAQRLLGYEPKYSVDEGMKMYAKWYAKQYS